MIKGQEIIEELGFKLPELDLVDEDALEIFFVDKYGIHGSFGGEDVKVGAQVFVVKVGQYEYVKIKGD